MKKKLSIMFALVLVISLLLVPATVSADGPPIIDGTMDPGEWGSVDFTGPDYEVYVLNDADYLYVAFKASSGDYTIASSMTNIYIYAGDDWGGECWAYTAAAPGQAEGLTYFTKHHLPSVTVKEGQESRTTTAIVSVSTLVAEWQIPLAEFPMGLRDPLAFDFMSFSEGLSGWDTAWLYDQEGFTLEANTVVGLIGDTPQTIAINVDPTSLDFGTVYPGDVVPGPSITVDNIGTVEVDVVADLNLGTVFDYLQLNGSYSSNYGGHWDIINGLSPNDGEVVTTGLNVPSTYSAQGPEETTLVFLASPATP